MFNVNPTHMKKMMQQLGMNMEEVPAKEVLIIQEDREIHIHNPKVVKMKMQGQETFQVSGEVHEETGGAESDIDADDVEMVMKQTGKSEEDARKALEEAEGDIAKAILNLSEE